MAEESKQDTSQIQDEHTYVSSKLVDQIGEFLEWRKSEEDRLAEVCDTSEINKKGQIKYLKECGRTVNNVEEKGCKILVAAQEEIKSLDSRLKVAINVLDRKDKKKVPLIPGCSTQEVIRLLASIGPMTERLRSERLEKEEALEVLTRTLKENEELTEKNDNLSIKLKQEADSYKSLSKRLQKIRQTNTVIVDLRAEVKEVNTIKDGLSERLDFRVREVNQLREEETRLKSVVKEQTDKVVDLENTNATLEEANKYLLSKNKGLETIASDLQEDVKKLHKHINLDELNMWKDRCEVLTQKANSVTHDEAMFQELQDTQRDLAESIQDYEELTIKFNKSNNLDKVYKSEEVSAKVKGLEAEIAKLIAQKGCMQAELDQCKRAFNEQQNARTEAVNSLSAYKSAYADRLNETRDLEVQVAELKIENDKLINSGVSATMVKELKEQVQTWKEDRHQWKEAAGQYEQQVTMLKEAITTWKTAWADQEYLTKGWKKKSNEYNLKYLTEMKKTNDVKAELDVTKETSESRRTRLVETNEALVKLRKEVSDLKEEGDSPSLWIIEL